MKQRLAYIDTLRLVATLMVVSIHVSSLFLSSTELEAKDEFFFSYVYSFSLCAVAIFVLMSGALLLGKQGQITYSQIFLRYIPRILWAITFFALPMCVIEQMATTRGTASFMEDVIVTSIINFLTGHSWSHMWYLYMLPGLYLVTPLLHNFILNTAKKDHTHLLVALIIMGILIPNISMLAKIDMHSYMMMPSFFATYYLGGYIYLHCPDDDKTLIVSLFCLIVYVAYCFFAADCPNLIVGPEFVLSIATAAALFCLFRRLSWNAQSLKVLSPYCFCIYIVHPIFLHVMFRILHIQGFISLGALVCLLVVVGMTFLLSLLTAYIVRKIPFMRKHVL